MPRRLSVAAGVVAAGLAAFLLSRPAEVAAQNPQLVAALRQELQEAKEKLAHQHDQLQQARKRVAALEEELRLEKIDDRVEAATIRRLRKQLLTMQTVKYAHYSVWKRKPGVPDAAVTSFIEDVYGMLAKQGTPRGVWAGGTSVPDVAGGEVTLLMLFDDPEGHKFYLADPATKKFYEKHGRQLDMVKALDVLVR